jgi:hypothetical protein
MCATAVLEVLSFLRLLFRVEEEMKVEVRRSLLRWCSPWFTVGAFIVLWERKGVGLWLVLSINTLCMSFITNHRL